MITYKNKLLLISIFACVALTSCSDFLDEVPDNRTEIDSADKVAELLVGAYPESSYFWMAESMSDNSTDIGPSNTNNRYINTTKYYWEDIDGDERDTPTHYWNACYAAISQANQALSSIEELGGGKELNGSKGEALVARAYAHYMLVNLWGKVYNPTTAASNLGVPIVIESEKVVLKDYTRASVQEVYDQVESDLLEGIPLLNDDYKQPKFHFTKHAAYVFASRFYQMLGNWDKVIEYTSKALRESPETLIRDWSYYRTFTGGSQQIRITHQSSEEPTNLLIVGASSLYARYFASGRYGVSSDLSDMIFRDGTHPLNKRWEYTRYTFSSTRYFIPKYREYFRYTNLSSSTGQPYCMNVLFTYDEALLNRAEAYVMKGNYDAAVKDLNSYLSKKTQNYNPSTDTLTYDDFVAFYQPRVIDSEFNPFYTISDEQLPFIKCILDCRQREFIHEGIRWLDNKRMNMEIVHLDNNGNTYVLSSNDPRRELEIPISAVTFGIEQNPR